MYTRISTQLILALALISIAVFALLSYILITAQRRSMIAQLERHSQEYIDTIGSSTRYAMMHNQREELHEIIDAIGKQPTVTKARILNKEGFIVYSPVDSEEGSKVDMDAEACYGCHAEREPRARLEREDWSRLFSDKDGQPHIGLIKPIYNEPACSSAECHAHPPDQSVLGVLDVTLTLADVEREAHASRDKAILLTAFTIFSTSAIGLLLFHARVARPVRELLGATRRVADGDLSSRIAVRRHDELGQLQGAFNEMTQRLAETRDQLYQSNKMASVGRLAAGIAHEINNPLTGVLTFSSLLLKQHPEPDPLYPDLDTIVQETKRCREIVKGLLDFSRQVPSQKTSVDFNQIVQRSLDIVDHQLSVNDISVECDLQADLPPVWVDGNKMQQVLLNLLVNAADAVDSKDGRVSISTGTVERGDRRWLQVQVADNGKGIPDEEREKIFEPFFTTKESGTGLGLAVVWGIVTEHDGTISVASEPGRGATFTIRLPIDGGRSGQEA